MKRWSKVGAAVLLVALVVGGFLWYGSARPVASTTDLLAAKADDWVKGKPTAQLTVIEYLDFECEACGAYYPLMKRLAKEYQDKVRFVTRHFPLPGHKNGLPASLAVEAAGRQGKYWEMHDMVFENQSSWGEKPVPTPKAFETYAQQLNLDMAKFRRDFNSREVRDRVERDRRSGVQLDVQYTPTFFVNGKKIENPRGYEEFRVVVEAALESLP